MQEKFLEFWEEPKNRKLAIGGALVLLSFPILNAILGGETKELEAFKEKPPEVIEPLYNNNTFEMIDKQDATEIWTAAQQDIHDQQSNIKNKEAAYEKRMMSLEEELDSMSVENKKLAGMVEQLLKVKSGQADMQLTTRGKKIKSPATMNASSPLINAGNTDTQQVQRTTQRTQYTNQPIFHGDVVRTITQNKMREVRGAGKVTETDLTSTTITAETQKAKNEKDKIAKDTKKKEEEEQFIYMPSGSLVSGTLISGVDAPTQLSKGSSQVPVMLRVKKEAILPNYFSLDVRECRIIGSAVGSLSSERVEIRSESISCIREDGQSIEANLDGWAVSTFDGKAGIKGRVVQKNGSMIAASLKAGFLEGFARNIAPQRVGQISTSADENPFTTIDVGSAMASGVLTGVGDSAERVAEYYINLAEQTFPVIELNPGINVDFILKRGVRLKLN